MNHPVAEGIVAVVFEWDGYKPPGSFYRHIQRLLSVWKRAGMDLEASPFGFWAQESVFFLADERLARLLAGIGEAKGCYRVFLLIEGRILALTEEDREKVRKLLRIWEKPGPRRYRSEQERQEALRRDVEDILSEPIAPVEEGVRKVITW